MKSTNGPSMLNALKRQGALEEEIKWIQDLTTGEALDAWIKRQDKVTPQQVKDFIAENQVEVYERTYGERDVDSKELRQAEERVEEAERDMHEANERGTLEEARQAEQDLQEYKWEYEQMLEHTSAKFGDDPNLTLPGAKEGSYREVVLRVASPKRTPKVTVEKGAPILGGDTYKVVVEGGGAGNNIRNLLDKPYATRAEAEVEAARIRKFDLKKISTRKEFTSPHFEDDPNVILHLRMNERVDADGKRMLFIEELQSDWAARGRDRGYADPANAARVSALRTEEAALDLSLAEHAVEWKQRKVTHPEPGDIDYRDKVGPPPMGAESGAEIAGWRMRYDVQEAALRKVKKANLEYRAEHDAKRDALAQKRSQIINERHRLEGTVPAAPFVAKRTGEGTIEGSNKWKSLGMKRAIRFAAEQGNIDRLGWISGKDTAERYNLRKHIETLEYDRLDKGFTRITAVDKDGNKLINDRRFPNENLDEAVGKEMADKILSQEKDMGEFSGIDLEVGGEGHIQMYDIDLPNMVKKYGKKWGAKVGKVDINTSAKLISRGAQEFRKTSAHYIDITPAMKESVMTEGQTMFMPKGERNGKVKPRKGSATARKTSMRLPLGAVAKQLRLERDLKKLKRN